MLAINSKKKAQKTEKERRKAARKRVAAVRRVAFAVLIVGLAGFFVYNNMDYVMTVGGGWVRSEEKPEKPEKPKKVKVERVKPEKPDKTEKPVKEYKSADEILGTPEFTVSKPELKALPPVSKISTVPVVDTPKTAVATVVSPQIPTAPIPVDTPKTTLAIPRQPVLPQTSPSSGTLLLSDITCRLADRADLRINVSVELSFSGEALRDEIDHKRGALTAVVGNVVRRYEYGNVAMASLRTDLLKSFNDILKEGKLNDVNIRNFRVE